MKRRQLLVGVGIGLSPFAGCLTSNGTESVDTRSPTTKSESPSSVADDCSRDEAWIRINAKEDISVEIAVFRGDEDPTVTSQARTLRFHQTLGLNASEEYSVAIPAIPDSDTSEKDEDKFVIRTKNGQLDHPIRSCTTYNVSASSNTVTLRGVE